MHIVALILLLGVFIRHDASDVIAPAVGMTPAAVFYMLGGVWEVILCSVIFLLSCQMKESIWRLMIRAAMVIGIIEAVQIPVCRVFVKDIHDVPQGVNLCNYLLGFPFGKVVMVLYLLILIMALGRFLAKRTP